MRKVALFVLLASWLVHFEPRAGRERIVALTRPIVEYGPGLFVLASLFLAYVLGRAATEMEQVADAAARITRPEHDESDPSRAI